MRLAAIRLGILRRFARHPVSGRRCIQEQWMETSERRLPTGFKRMSIVPSGCVAFTVIVIGITWVQHKAFTHPDSIYANIEERAQQFFARARPDDPFRPDEKKRKQMLLVEVRPKIE